MSVLTKYSSCNGTSVTLALAGPTGYNTATQAHLKDLSSGLRTIPDDIIYSTTQQLDEITGLPFYRAKIHDTKLHEFVSWTDNQNVVIIKKFEDGADYIELQLRSDHLAIPKESTIRIYKSDVFKSIGTPDKTGTYLNTSKVF